METTLFMESGPLRLSMATGSLYVDHGGDEPEYLGHIDDPDAEPWEYTEDWAVLVDRWRDVTQYGRACVVTARDAFYFGVNPAG